MFGSKKKEAEQKQAKKPGFFGALFGSTGKSSSSGSTKKPAGSSKKSSGSWRKSYDDGYNDVYLDETYDKDRYKHDRDYRNGVEDATLDLFEEEEEW